MIDNLMEGLITAQLNPVKAYCRRHQSTFLPTYTPRVVKRAPGASFGMMKHPGPLYSVAASVQPVENSMAGRVDNTLPSKGHIRECK